MEEWKKLRKEEKKEWNLKKKKIILVGKKQNN